MMRLIRLAEPDDFDGWRLAARAALLSGWPPDQLSWHCGEQAGDLFGNVAIELPLVTGPLTISRRFVELAQAVILHHDPARFALLYQLLWRLRTTPQLIHDQADPLLRRLERLAKAVRRDIHKMRAFVRFRAVQDDLGAHFIAWFEPEHHIIRANASFFVGRFATMRWSILTPQLSLYWDGMRLNEAPGAARADMPGDDPLEVIWRAYYAAIFNPARLKTKAMLKEMPKKYWANLPEADLIPGLIAGARQRELAMLAAAQTV
jgi:uracil-DNA glycosylase